MPRVWDLLRGRTWGVLVNKGAISYCIVGWQAASGSEVETLQVARSTVQQPVATSATIATIAH